MKGSEALTVRNIILLFAIMQIHQEKVNRISKANYKQPGILILQPSSSSSSTYFFFFRSRFCVVCVCVQCK